MLYSRETQYDPIIAQAGAAYGVPVALLKAVFANESAFNPAAMGDQGRAFGIGQMWAATARGLGFNGNATDLLRPSVAIPLTAKYLSQHLRKYKGDHAAALSAYNAGHSMIPPAGPQAIPNATNRDYLRRGLIHLGYYNGQVPEAQARAALKNKSWLTVAAVAAGGGAVLMLLAGLVLIWLGKRGAA